MTARYAPAGRLLHPRQVELLSAALRHTRDAERLLEHASCRSVDQAWHLAGFGPECARKACLTERWADIPLGHDLGRDAADLLAVAVSLDPVAWRLGLPKPAAGDALASWNPNVRYAATGTANPDATRSAVATARGIVDDTVSDLWAAGLLPEIPE